MRQITDQLITALAPNAAAAQNGKKISQKGGFVRLEQAADDCFFVGECTGSGKNNYITSVDFADAAQPVFRCTCPSRQFPCKHSLGLLYEMLAGKTFGTCDVPEDILKKRDKLQARTEKAAAPESDTPAAPPKVNKAARTKKLQKQLEGLSLTSKLLGELLTTGLGAMGGAALTNYRQLSKQLGDYYLPGPQRLLNQLILEIEAFQKDGLDLHYEAAVQALLRLRALVKKSSVYLTEKLEKEDVAQEDNLLYEELGGVWKRTELAALGLSKQNVNLLQLGFWVAYDPASSQYIDTACWADLETGELSLTNNLRPAKAVKYIKQEDSLFGVAQVPTLCYYPGEGNRRVRWEGMQPRALKSADLAAMASFATPLAPAVKQAKTLLKNTLADPLYFALLRFSKIGRSADGIVLLDEAGDSILLSNAPDLEETLSRLSVLPDAALLENQLLLGAFFYDAATHRLLLAPVSILTSDAIVRLLY